MNGNPKPNVSLTAWSKTSSPALSRIKWLFVIARNSTFTYVPKAHGCLFTE
jgi:TolB-like protein